MTSNASTVHKGSPVSEVTADGPQLRVTVHLSRFYETKHVASRQYHVLRSSALCDLAVAYRL